MSNQKRLKLNQMSNQMMIRSFAAMLKEIPRQQLFVTIKTMVKLFRVLYFSFFFFVYFILIKIFDIPETYNVQLRPEQQRYDRYGRYGETIPYDRHGHLGYRPPGPYLIDYSYDCPPQYHHYSTQYYRRTPSPQHADYKSTALVNATSKNLTATEEKVMPSPEQGNFFLFTVQIKTINFPKLKLIYIFY